MALRTWTREKGRKRNKALSLLRHFLARGNSALIHVQDIWDGLIGQWS